MVLSLFVPVARWLADRRSELHIPDGFLSIPVALVFWVISAVVLGLALRRVQAGGRQAPLMGIMAAFIFAAQMINFPVAGGTSGHFVGGALAAIVLGPWAGMLVVAAVVIVQALLFQDGGLIAIGPNVFNMAILTAAISYGLFRAVVNQSTGVRLVVIGVGAWLSVVGSALLLSLQLALSGTAALGVVAPPMIAVHAVIGLGEAAITVAAYLFISRTRPDLLTAGTAGGGGRGWVIAGAAVASACCIVGPTKTWRMIGFDGMVQPIAFASSSYGR